MQRPALGSLAPIREDPGIPLGDQLHDLRIRGHRRPGTEQLRGIESRRERFST